MTDVLADHELQLIDGYWRAANYLSVGQIYLYDNPLLKKPLSKGSRETAAGYGHWEQRRDSIFSTRI